MKELIINQIVTPLLVAVVGTILEIGRRQLKTFLDSKQALIAKQEQALEQTMGTEQYNKDKAYLQGVVKTVEQLGQEFDWQGAAKHSKVLEMISGKTGLSDDEIFNIIKETVLEINQANKPKLTEGTTITPTIVTTPVQQ
jgi:hypothetical protein